MFDSIALGRWRAVQNDGLDPICSIAKTAKIIKMAVLGNKPSNIFSFFSNQFMLSIKNPSFFAYFKIKTSSHRIILMIHQTLTLMELLLLAEQQNKNCHTKTQSGASSPSVLSNAGTLSEGFVPSDLGDTEKFEIDAQIQPNSFDELDKNQQKKHWNFDQQRLLLQLHDQLGNKWTDIANMFPGRDHNSVKNHFYANIRKSMRRVNHFIKIHFARQLKSLNSNHISKMITLLSEKTPNDQLGEAKEQEITEIKRFLFNMSRKNEDDLLDAPALEQIRLFVTRISTLVDSVKKNNCIIKKCKNKQKLKQAQEKGCTIRESSTIRKTVILAEEAKSANVEDIAYKPTVKYEQNQNNYIFFFMPCESQQIPVISNYQPYWVDPAGQCLFFGQNIYGNS